LPHPARVSQGGHDAAGGDRLVGCEPPSVQGGVVRYATSRTVSSAFVGRFTNTFFEGEIVVKPGASEALKESKPVLPAASCPPCETRAGWGSQLIGAAQKSGWASPPLRFSLDDGNSLLGAFGLFPILGVET